MSSRRRSLAGRLPRPERLLPFACMAAAAALFASELMTTFELTPPGGLPLCDVQASSRHHFALAVLAIFAVVAVIIAVTGPSKPAAVSVGVIGVLALVLFLIIDLPKANNVGTIAGCSPTTIGSFSEAKANPQAGFWLELVGALGLALSGLALATLSAEQLATLRPRHLGRGQRETGHDPPGDPGDAVADVEPEAVADEDTEARPPRRARARDARPS